MSLQEFIPLLVGMKYDLFVQLEEHHKNNITSTARFFATKMHAISLIYCSALTSVNVEAIFEVIIAKILDLKPHRKEIHDVSQEAIIEFQQSIEEIHAQEKEEVKWKKEKNKWSKSFFYPFNNFQSLIFSAIEPYHFDTNRQ